MKEKEKQKKEELETTMLSACPGDGSCFRQGEDGTFDQAAGICCAKGCRLSPCLDAQEVEGCGLTRLPANLLATHGGRCASCAESHRAYFFARKSVEGGQNCRRCGKTDKDIEVRSRLCYDCWCIAEVALRRIMDEVDEEHESF